MGLCALCIIIARYLRYNRCFDIVWRISVDVAISISFAGEYYDASDFCFHGWFCHDEVLWPLWTVAWYFVEIIRQLILCRHTLILIHFHIRSTSLFYRPLGVTGHFVSAWNRSCYAWVRYDNVIRDTVLLRLYVGLLQPQLGLGLLFRPYFGLLQPLLGLGLLRRPYFGLLLPPLGLWLLCRLYSDVFVSLCSNWLNRR